MYVPCAEHINEAKSDFFDRFLGLIRR